MSCISVKLLSDLITGKRVIVFGHDKRLLKGRGINGLWTGLQRAIYSY